jgi:hypothetical protein
MNDDRAKLPTLPSSLKERLLDQYQLVRELMDEADKLREENTLTANIAAFSILTQWIEDSLVVIIHIVVNITAGGDYLGLKIKNVEWQKDVTRPRTLGQKKNYLRNLFHCATY